MAVLVRLSSRSWFATRSFVAVALSLMATDDDNSLAEHEDGADKR